MRRSPPMQFDTTALAVLVEPLPGETLYSLTGKLAMAALRGAIIGAEREYRRNQDGLRTHMLMATAASAFTMIAGGMLHEETTHTGEPINGTTNLRHTAANGRRS